ncbi:hypothetical protein A9993_25100 [Rahnella victoriana]|nr:hypothetical protein A9993_25100 [Rahnella victoriana]
MSVKSDRNTVVQIIGIAFGNEGRTVKGNRARDFIPFTGNGNITKTHGAGTGHYCTAVCCFIANTNNRKHD